MRKIIEDNYNSTVKRCLITKKTKVQDFIDKIDEEVAIAQVLKENEIILI